MGSPSTLLVALRRSNVTPARRQSGRLLRHVTTRRGAVGTFSIPQSLTSAPLLKTPMGPGDVTQILLRLREGEASAANELLPLVYDELRALARRQFRRRDGTPTLQPTALVHEAYLRLVGGAGAAWNDRAHFFAVAALAMRQVLSNHARDQDAAKRGGGLERVTLTDGHEPHAGPGLDLDLLALNQALERLEAADPRQARIVQLRYLAGMSVEETAHVLSLSTKTVQREWRMARAWLAATLGGA